MTNFTLCLFVWVGCLLVPSTWCFIKINFPCFLFGNPYPIKDTAPGDRADPRCPPRARPLAAWLQGVAPWSAEEMATAQRVGGVALRISPPS